MPSVVALIATSRKSLVAFSAQDGESTRRYRREMLSDWLKAALLKSGRSQSDVARMLTESLGRSVDRAAVNKMVNGGRQIKADEMIAIARYLNAPAPTQERESVPRMVRVAAHVEAGYFSEHWEWPYEDQYEVAVPADPHLEHFRLYAAETRGPSMNRRWPEKTVVVFTNVAETEESPIPGKRYIVERTRPDGMREHTVKLLHQDDKGAYWLVPESTDLAYQAPIPVTGNDGDEVSIIGRVHYSVSRE